MKIDVITTLVLVLSIIYLQEIHINAVEFCHNHCITQIQPLSIVVGIQNLFLNFVLRDLIHYNDIHIYYRVTNRNLEFQGLPPMLLTVSNAVESSGIDSMPPN